MKYSFEPSINPQYPLERVRTCYQMLQECKTYVAKTMLVKNQIDYGLKII